VTLFNTATFYGPLTASGYGANLRLIRKCLEQPGVDRARVEIMCKIGMSTRAPEDAPGTVWKMSGDAKWLSDDVDFALAELGTPYLDTIVLCRVPADVPIEDAVRAMAAIVASGRARKIGLSEASAATLRRAAAVAPIACIEQEWSLWARDAEAAVIPAAREVGARIVAYSPLGRGFLTGDLRSREDAGFGGARDFRLAAQPRFAEGAFAANLALVDAAAATVAARVGCSVGALALAWLRAKGDDVVPIPGTSKVAHLDANLDADALKLGAADVAELDALFAPSAVVGERYAGGHNQFQTNA